MTLKGTHALCGVGISESHDLILIILCSSPRKDPLHFYRQTTLFSLSEKKLATAAFTSTLKVKFYRFGILDYDRNQRSAISFIKSRLDPARDIIKVAAIAEGKEFTLEEWDG